MNTTNDFSLGRLKRTLPKKCPDCKHNLQLRVISEADNMKGLTTSIEEEIEQCPNCGYENKPEQKKKKRVALREEFSKEAEKNAKHFKQQSTKRDNGRGSTQGSRSYRR